MKKSILNLGKPLNKKEQQTINGGTYYCSNGSQALVACINGEFVGFCRNGGIFSYVIAPYCP